MVPVVVKIVARELLLDHVDGSLGLTSLFEILHIEIVKVQLFLHARFTFSNPYHMAVKEIKFLFKIQIKSFLINFILISQSLELT